MTCLWICPLEVVSLLPFMAKLKMFFSSLLPVLPLIPLSTLQSGIYTYHSIKTALIKVTTYLYIATPNDSQRPSSLSYQQHLR